MLAVGLTACIAEAPVAFFTVRNGMSESMWVQITESSTASLREVAPGESIRPFSSALRQDILFVDDRCRVTSQIGPPEAGWAGSWVIEISTPTIVYVAPAEAEGAWRSSEPAPAGIAPAACPAPMSSDPNDPALGPGASPSSS